MEDYSKYNTRLDIKYAPLELINIPEIVKNCTDKWFNQTLAKVNDSVMRIGIVEGEYHWHKHETDDELFFVLEGKLFVDLEAQTYELEKWQGLTIPRGVLHRTRSPQKTIMLMMEPAGIIPTGD